MFSPNRIPNLSEFSVQITLGFFQSEDIILISLKIRENLELRIGESTEGGIHVPSSLQDLKKSYV